MQLEEAADVFIAPDHFRGALRVLKGPRGSTLANFALRHQAFGQALQLEQIGAAVTIAGVDGRGKVRDFFRQQFTRRMDLAANFKKAERIEAAAVFEDV